MTDIVFLGWGQSEIISPPATSVPSHLQSADTGIKIWNGSSWATLANGSNNNTFSNNGYPTSFGMEAEFLYQFRQEFPSVNVNFFKHSVGSTSITYWAPGGTGYNAMKSALPGALALLSNPVIVGSVAWIGKTDADQNMAQNTFQTNFENHIASALVDFGTNPTTKYIIMRLFEGTPSGSYTSIRAAQAALAAVDTTTRVMVDTDGYSYSDGIHPDATGCVSAGQGGYTAYRSLNKKWAARWGS